VGELLLNLWRAENGAQHLQFGEVSNAAPNKTHSSSSGNSTGDSSQQGMLA
jgi:hypothetical protein